MDIEKVVSLASDLIKKFEGLNLKPYRCPAGVWTIGYGTVAFLDGTKVSEKTLPITKEKAEAELRERIKKEIQLISAAYGWLNEFQLSALVSFRYNIGNLEGKGLKTALQNRQPRVVAEMMLQYIKAGGVDSKGLINRRKAEVELFNAA